MSVDVFMQGAEGGAESFGIDPVRYARMEVNALNRAGRWIARVLLVEPISKATGIRKTILADRISLRQASTGLPVARIVPSSHGIPARCYRHRAEPVDSSGVRARILVDWIEGEKVAAGFINPASTRRLPLATRSVRERNLKKPAKHNPHIKQYRYNYVVPQDAMGPSAAALFRAIDGPGLRTQAADKVVEEFSLGLDKELF